MGVWMGVWVCGCVCVCVFVIVLELYHQEVFFICGELQRAKNPQAPVVANEDQVMWEKTYLKIMGPLSL